MKGNIMRMTSYTLDPQEFQEVCNSCKDEIIEKINSDHGLNINPCEYVYVLQTRGCLGRVWDAFLGKNEDDATRRVLLRICPPNAQITGLGEKP